jgi:hypothetical protein
MTNSMREWRNAYKILIGIPERRRQDVARTQLAQDRDQ